MRIRKQDEAPEMGADSSLRLCDGCKNTFQDDFDICPDCSQLAEGTTMSRNTRYEQRKRADGLKKLRYGYLANVKPNLSNWPKLAVNIATYHLIRCVIPRAVNMYHWKDYKGRH